MTKFESNIDFEAGYVLPIDKPYHWTSADVVRKLKHALKYAGYPKIKIGHAGTLDPLATGVLLVCIGKATKRVDELQAEMKEYLADIQLGATTPCYDMEKEVDAIYPFEHITREDVESLARDMVGEQLQIPPIFSAKLIDGKRAYEYARAGETVEMKKAQVTIYSVKVEEFALPLVRLRIECSKGTYIRSIARDFGLALGSGGYLSALRRTRSGGYNQSNMVDMEDFIQYLEQK